jgi:hypothetical protein
VKQTSLGEDLISKMDVLSAVHVDKPISRTSNKYEGRRIMSAITRSDAKTLDPRTRYSVAKTADLECFEQNLDYLSQNAHKTQKIRQ